VRAIFELKVFQSLAESAPVVVDDASPREMPDPEIERPLAAPEIRLTLLLKVIQSATERAPVVVEFAIAMPNTPVRLLYVSGQFAESDVSPILLATVPEREVRFPERVFTVAISVERFHESVFRFHERVEIFPVAVARLALVVLRFVFVVARFPERVFMFPERVAIFPVAVAILLLIVTS
jgi:hypothetical protein